MPRATAGVEMVLFAAGQMLEGLVEEEEVEVEVVVVVEEEEEEEVPVVAVPVVEALLPVVVGFDAGVVVVDDTGDEETAAAAEEELEFCALPRATPRPTLRPTRRTVRTARPTPSQNTGRESPHIFFFDGSGVA